MEGGKQQQHLQGWAKASCIISIHYCTIHVICLSIIPYFLVVTLMTYLLGNDGWECHLLFPTPVYTPPSFPLDSKLP